MPRLSYERDGFVVLRSLFDSTEIEAAAEEAAALLGRHDLISTRNLRCRWQPNVHTGECQFETFDPKTEAPEEIRTVTGVTQTKVPGLVFGDTMRQLAKLADKLENVLVYGDDDNYTKFDRVATSTADPAAEHRRGGSHRG